jgi:NAD(P)-dependent dehydrogenase (short-subunit alcohol dehydrogenase family)
MAITDAFSPKLFEGRTVLVTGGTSGIGLGCAHAFRDLGARVTATGATEAERVQAADEKSNAGIAFSVLDVRETAAVEGLMRGFDKLDVLVNAAGVIRRDLEHDADVFADVVAINLTGTMRMSAAAKSKLVEAQGCVVNLASMLAFFGGPRVPAYSSSKGGIAQLTKSLAAAWAGEGVRVNAVAPGWITTALTQALQDDL